MLTASSSHTFAIEPPSSGLKDENISFGWADFPLIGDGDDRTSHSVPLSPASTNSTIEFTESSPETKEEEFSVLSPAFLKQDSDLTCPTMIESSDSDFDEDEGSLFSSTDDAEGAIVVDNTSAGVRFSSVCVREYNLTVGDHPLTDVFPLALDWDFVEGESIPIDIFEAKAKQRKCSWTRHKASRLALYQRTYRLQVVSGLSYADILELEQARLERQRQDCERDSPSCTAAAFRAQLPKSQSLTNLRESLARYRLTLIGVDASSFCCTVKKDDLVRRTIHSSESLQSLPFASDQCRENCGYRACHVIGASLKVDLQAKQCRVG